MQRGLSTALPRRWRFSLYVGFGAPFDAAKVVAVPAGAVYVTPADVPHYVGAKDGEAMDQEAGVGPSGTSFLFNSGLHKTP